MPERFSDRHRYRGPEQEIAVREEAPENLRFAIPLIAQDAGMSPTAMRRCPPSKPLGRLTVFVQHLAAEDGITVKSVLINSLCHGTYYEDV